MHLQESTPRFLHLLQTSKIFTEDGFHNLIMTQDVATGDNSVAFGGCIRKLIKRF